MKKIFFYLVLSTFLISCGNSDNRSVPQNNIQQNQNTTTSQNEIQQNQNTTTSQNEIQQDNNEINPETNTIFDKDGNTVYLKLSDLDNVFIDTTSAKSEFASYIKAISPKNPNLTLWASKFTINFITTEFETLQEIAKHKQTLSENIARFDENLSHTVIMDMLIEQTKNKIHSGLTFAFFSQQIYKSATDLKITMGGETYPVKKTSLQASEPLEKSSDLTKSCINLVVVPISDVIMSALTKLKNGDDITISLKLDGQEKSYTFKYIMKKIDSNDTDAGIYPLLMKYNSLKSNH